MLRLINANNAKRTQKTIDEFKHRHGPQSDDEFLKVYGLKSDRHGSSIALAVRRALAHIGHIEKEFIQAEMTFEELETLPDVRQCLEFHLDHLVQSLEAELHQQFSQSQAERIRVPDGLTVSDFVHDIIEAIAVGTN